MTQKELICEIETDSQDTEDRLVVAKGEAGREKDGLGLGVWYPTRLLCPWNSPGKNAGAGFPWWLSGKESACQ